MKKAVKSAQDAGELPEPLSFWEKVGFAIMYLLIIASFAYSGIHLYWYFTSSCNPTYQSLEDVPYKCLMHDVYHPNYNQ